MKVVGLHLFEISFQMPYYHDHRYPHYQNLNVIGFDLSELINFQDVPQRYGNADEQRPS